MNATAIKLVIKIWHDDQAEDPCEGDGNWKVYSFSRRHLHFATPESVGFEANDDGVHVPDAELQAKLDSGLAFLLSYYEHSQSIWSLAGEGPQCRWDSVQLAGILVWEHNEDDMGAKTVVDRRADAKTFIERFTLWCNGEIFGYTVEARQPCPTCHRDEEVDGPEGIDMPSVGGYYSDDIEGMVIDMKDNIGETWKDYEAIFEEENPFGIADEAKRLWNKKEE